MKILHVGGYYSVTSEIVQQHQLLGHDVVWIGGAPAEAPFEAPLGCKALFRSLSSIEPAGFHIIQVHDLSALMYEAPEQSIEIFSRLSSRGARLYYYSCFEEDLLPWDSHHVQDGAQAQRFEQAAKVLTHSKFSHLFRGSLSHQALTQLNIPWSWLAPALPIHSVAAAAWRELSPAGVRFLHIPFRTYPEDTAAIARVFEDLRTNTRFKIELQISPPEALMTRESLNQAFHNCDVYVESIQREWPGFLGYEALLRGKMVLSGNSQAAQHSWPQLGLCPVMHSTADNLYRRIESIAKEPRCLRDLSKRAREYIELYHDPHSMAEKSITVYQQSL